ncbi:MAG: NAD(P)/FAD-dependent oxidoreductase [Cyanophyceae cyanobacterium]
MRVTIVGCGVVGAAIAYELSCVPGLEVTLIDQQTPASGSTGAALGVLMGVISHKTKGRAWRLRQESLERYETLIPELEALTGQQIPFNRQGILRLFAAEERERWEKLVEVRHSQGWQLEIWDYNQVRRHCPQLQSENMTGAVYSPQDRQVHPAALTQALVAGATHNGVRCLFEAQVKKLASIRVESANSSRCNQVLTTAGAVESDWIVVAAGLGSTALTSTLQQKSDIRPVLGQALQLKLERPCGNPEFQPIVTGDDVHLVPVTATEYWVGATVEFVGAGEAIAQPALLEAVRQQAISFCPALAEATVVRTWSGLRPRPEGQPAPLIGLLPGYSNVLLATGHYRNGVLLAPATANAIRRALG